MRGRSATTLIHPDPRPHRVKLRSILASSLVIVSLSPAARLHAQRRDTAAVALPGVTARAAGAECGIRDEPRARALWEAVRARYSPAGDSLSLWTTGMSSAADWVPPERLLRFDSTSSHRADGSTTGWDAQQNRRDGWQRLLEYHAAPRAGRGGRGMAGVYRAFLSGRIATDGYARLLNGVNADLTAAWSAWEYPPLEAELASHFVSAEFGRRNVFALASDQGRTTIEFCGARPFRSRPYLTGVLVLRADSTLERAWWRYRTPAPDEQAGGQAEFAPYSSAGGAPLLLPVRGVFYRRNGRAEFYQRRQTFDGWMTASREAVPDQALEMARRELPNPVPVPGRAGGAPRS